MTPLLDDPPSPPHGVKWDFDDFDDDFDDDDEWVKWVLLLGLKMAASV